MSKQIAPYLLMLALLLAGSASTMAAPGVLPQAQAAHFCRLLINDGEGIMPLGVHARRVVEPRDSLSSEQIFVEYLLRDNNWQSLRLFPHRQDDGSVVWYASAEELYTYSSDYSSTTELVQAMQDIGIRMSQEGSVLLKNNNAALPLSAEELGKVSLLGFQSYFPNKGAILGPTAAENHGTDADTVDLVGALEARGFTLNSTLKEMYNSDALKSIFKSEVATWTGTAEYLNLTAPSVGGVYTDKEPSIAEMDSANAGWRDSLNESNVMIITIGRAGSENADYTPGEAGVDPADGLNQTDPLGLSDDERNLIAAAVEA